MSAPERSWTVTRVSADRILSPACLPIPPPGLHQLRILGLRIVGLTNPQTKNSIPTVIVGMELERKTRLEPATSTLARLRSTNWATSACTSILWIEDQKELHRTRGSVHLQEECKNTGIVFFRQNFLAYLYWGVYKVLEGTATSGLPWYLCLYNP